MYEIKESKYLFKIKTNNFLNISHIMYKYKINNPKCFLCGQPWGNQEHIINEC